MDSIPLKLRKPRSGPVSPLTKALKAGAAGVVLRSEGQRLLLAINAGPAAISHAIGFSQNAVVDWRFGRKVPSPPARVMLRDAYAIPPIAWTRLPSTAGITATEPEPPPVDVGPAPSTLDSCLELLAQIRAARKRPDILPADQTRLAHTEAKILTLRHRLEKEAELLEDRLVRDHPAWRRIQTELARVLAHHPAAAAEVVEALKRLGV